EHDLEIVDVAVDAIDAGVGEGIRRLGFLARYRPVPGEDHLHRQRGIDRTRAEQEGIDTAQHGGDRLGGDKSELAGLGGFGGSYAADIDRLADVAEIAAG